MTAYDFAKATVLCGGIAYFVYSIPVVSQVLVIAMLSLLWLSYLHRTISRLRQH